MIAGLLLAFGAVGPIAPADEAHQTVTIGWDAGTRSCSARVGIVDIGDPAADPGRAALVRALAGRQDAVQLQGIDGAPYACVDAVLLSVRAAGRGVKIGFLSEPASR